MGGGVTSCKVLYWWSLFVVPVFVSFLCSLSLFLSRYVPVLWGQSRSCSWLLLISCRYPSRSWGWLLLISCRDKALRTEVRERRVWSCWRCVSVCCAVIDCRIVLAACHRVCCVVLPRSTVEAAGVGEGRCALDKQLLLVPVSVY